MIARRSGTIVNIGSVTGLRTLPWSAAFGSSKAAVRGITDALRLELSGYGIHVVEVVMGGYVDYEFNERS